MVSKAPNKPYNTEEITYTLEDLFSADVGKAVVKVLDTGGDILELALVRALNLAALADGEVQRQTNATVVGVLREPAGAARGGGWGEAEHVVTGIGSREGEAARRRAALGDDAVVVVEGFLEKLTVRLGLSWKQVRLDLCNSQHPGSMKLQRDDASSGGSLHRQRCRC